MKDRIEISKLLASPPIGEKVTVAGWVRAFRGNKFLALNDGSTMNTLQVVVDYEKFNEDTIKNISFHACVLAKGMLVESQGS